MTTIDALLEAAEYLERREREDEHGYARFSSSRRWIRRAAWRRKGRGNRTTHNELEKNRRAHLKNCLDALKDMVPLGPEASRHTTLGLLTKAKKFIKNLEEKDRKHNHLKEQLSRNQRYLKRRLEQLQQFRELYKRRSVSECSSSTVSSSHSTTSSHSSAPSPVSESDEVDVIGYGSTQSDTDDYSSAQSASSDSGMSISATLLRFSEMETV